VSLKIGTHGYEAPSPAPTEFLVLPHCGRGKKKIEKRMKKVDLLENESAKQTNKQTQPAIPYKYYIYMVQTLVATTESNTIDSSILRPLSIHSAQFVPRNSVFLAPWDHVNVNHVIR
jgi:hypothetical protein